MAQTLSLTNYSSNNALSQTRLTAAINAGAGTLPVENAEDFTTGFILLGTPGSTTSELLPATSINAGTTITLGSPTLLKHNQYEPVYVLFGDKLKVYSALDAGLGYQPPDTSFSVLAGMPIAIDANKTLTTYTDPAGSGNYWYKYTFFNSGSSSETTLASSIAVRGTFTVAYCSIDEIRQEAGFKFAPYVDDSQIDSARQAAQDTINGQLNEFYETPLQPPIPDSLRRICMVLAAGYLRQTQYSQISDPQVNGGSKIKWAEGELNKLSMKERVLVNKQGQALDGPGASGGVEGWPNASAATTASSQGGSPRVFRMGDIQGQPYTVDPSGNPVGNLYYGRRW